MRTNTRLALAAFAAVALLAGCAAMGPQVTSDYDAAVDFSQYTTYDFMTRAERGVERSYDSIVDRRLMTAAAREMEARGYRRAEADPDLLINFAVVTETVEEVTTVPGAGWPGPWYWRHGYYHPWPAYETYIDRYEQGMVFIDLVDRERRQLVWEGRAVERVTQAAKEDPAAALDERVRQIFAQYPFRAGPTPR